MKLFSKNNNEKKGKKFRIPVFLIVLIACLTTLVIVSLLEAEGSNTDDEPIAMRNVSVIEATPDNYPAKINVYGEVVPEWKTEMKSQVNGEIVWISPRCREGNIVHKGDVLFEVESASYISALLEAKTRLATAKINLLSAQKEAEDALANWKRSGIEGRPSSELVLRKPQLQAAKDEHAAAEAALKTAQIALSYTKITAPFDGIIVRRYINLGEAIGTGSTVLTLYSINKALITVQVSNTQFHLLSSDLQKIKATLSDSETGHSWQAAVKRHGQRIDNTSRLHPLILEVDHPLQQKPALLSGQFVQVELTGKPMHDILKAPESALTEGGFVWYIDAKNELQSFKVIPHFYQNKEIYFSLPDHIATPVRIAVNPNSSYMNGTAVNPVIIKK